MWGSGEKFLMNSYRSIPPRHFSASYIINDMDPYKVTLTIWKIFL